MQQLKHENIVEWKATYEDQHQLVIVMEMLRGGHIFDQLHQLRGYSEQKAAEIFVQVWGGWGKAGVGEERLSLQRVGGGRDFCAGVCEGRGKEGQRGYFC
jgi:hypothetical protein